MKIHLTKVIVASVVLYALVGSAWGQFTSGSLPPIYSLLLEEHPKTRLELVLEAFNDPSSDHVFVAAHRGGKEFDDVEMIPGNSIANIDNALSKGFDLYESDIEILGNGTDDKSDDVLVVFHDPIFNNLTNTEITTGDDLLSSADLAYAKSLFLTYDNKEVSNERIPTLDEFLSAAKDKIMLKFDPKFFDRTSLNKIYDAITSAGMVEQVLLRVGGTALENADDDGYDTRMIMRRYNGIPPSVSDIQALIQAYPELRAISIPGNDDPEVEQPDPEMIAAANAAGLIVEIHDLNRFTDQDRADAIEAGVRQFHSFKPTVSLNYLEQNGHREF